MPASPSADHGQPVADTGTIHSKPPVKAVPKALAKVEKPAEKIAPAATATKVAAKAEPAKAAAPVKLAALEPAKQIPAKPAALLKAEPAAKPVADKSSAPVKAASLKMDGVPALRLASDASAP